MSRVTLPWLSWAVTHCPALWSCRLYFNGILLNNPRKRRKTTYAFIIFKQLVFSVLASRRLFSERSWFAARHRYSRPTTHLIIYRMLCLRHDWFFACVKRTGEKLMYRNFIIFYCIRRYHLSGSSVLCSVIFHSKRGYLNGQCILVSGRCDDLELHDRAGHRSGTFIANL